MLSVLAELENYKYRNFLHNAAALHFVLVARAGRQNSFAGRWIGRQKPNEWPEQSLDLTLCSFLLRIGSNRKYATRSKGYLINRKYKFELTYRCLFWPQKNVSLCLSVCIRVCKMMGSVLKNDSNIGMWGLKVVQDL